MWRKVLNELPVWSMMNYTIDFDKLRRLGRRWGVKEEILDKLVEKYEKVLEETPPDIEINNWIRNRRSPKKFVEDLVTSWFVEDLIGEWLRQKIKEIDPEAIVRGAGTDKERRIIPGQRPKGVTTKSDFEVIFSDGTERRVEVQYSNEDRDSYDIKDSKVRRALKEGTLFVFVILPKDKYFTLTPQEVVRGREPYPNPRWGGKPCYNIPKREVVYKDMKEPLRFPEN